MDGRHTRAPSQGNGLLLSAHEPDSWISFEVADAKVALASPVLSSASPEFSYTYLFYLPHADMAKAFD